MYQLNEIGRYGFAPIGRLEDMVRESFLQLCTVGKTRQEISSILGVSVKTVRQYEKKYNQPIPDAFNPTRMKRLRDRTVEEYMLLKETQTLTEIANEWGVSKPTLDKWRVEKGLVIKKKLLQHI